MNNPFFVVGCVRSGTTMLRDIFRMHPNLAAPEETHFYRWAEPFGTPGYDKIVANNKVLQHHRELDGISEQAFQRMLRRSGSRADLCRKYMNAFIKRAKPNAGRWFDKTPQNIYGAALIAEEFRGASFVHIVRNPIDVAASLRIGKVMRVENLNGACCYWNEAVAIVHTLKRAYPDRVFEVRYEDFVRDPLEKLQEVLEFLGEKYVPGYFEGVVTMDKSHRSEGILNVGEVSTIERVCRVGMLRYGYLSKADSNASGREEADPPASE